MSKADRDNLLNTRDLIIKAIANDFGPEAIDQEVFTALVVTALGLAFDLNRIADSLEEIAINTQGRP